MSHAPATPGKRCRRGAGAGGWKPHLNKSHEHNEEVGGFGSLGRVWRRGNPAVRGHRVSNGPSWAPSTVGCVSFLMGTVGHRRWSQGWGRRRVRCPTGNQLIPIPDVAVGGKAQEWGSLRGYPVALHLSSQPHLFLRAGCRPPAPWSLCEC